MIPLWEILVRLIASAVVGGIIGFQREIEDKPAGLRTHILVCVGSTLIMLTSIYIYEAVELKGKVRADPSRIAAQVVTGIGFLGAGTIIRYGTGIVGLTTAAGIWATSGIGLAIGVGFYTGAAISTILLLIALIALEKLEKLIKKIRKYRTLIVEAQDVPGQLGAVATTLGKLGINIRYVNLKYIAAQKVKIEFTVDIPKAMSKEKIIEELQNVKGVSGIQW